MGDLTEHFSRKELECKCKNPDCDICFVSQPLLNGLEALRKYVNEPIKVTSGCRCPSHNKAVGGKRTSEHLTTLEQPCEGADIKSRNRYKLLQGALLIFDRVGISKNWIHVGCDNLKPQPTYWVYPPKTRK